MSQPWNLRFVDLDGDPAGAARAGPTEILIGFARHPLNGPRLEAAEQLDCTVVAARSAGDDVPRAAVAVADVDAACDRLSDRVEANWRAAVTLCGLLRVNETVPVAAGLVTESLAYSMLLAGPEFARWRATNPVRPIPDATEPPVQLSRAGDRLDVVLNRPDRRNAFSASMRDGLVEALDLAALDSTIKAVRIRGNGVAFCSGGDLDEFGSTTDVALAHTIRIERSVAARIAAVRDKVQVELHGACIGAGIELPSFAARIAAAPGSFFALPELEMGLVPGAGGTVGITGRIGRWRTAYLALSGNRIEADTAREWGMIDAVG